MALEAFAREVQRLVRAAEDAGNSCFAAFHQPSSPSIAALSSTSSPETNPAHVPLGASAAAVNDGHHIIFQAALDVLLVLSAMAFGALDSCLPNGRHPNRDTASRVVRLIHAGALSTHRDAETCGPEHMHRLSHGSKKVCVLPS